MKILINESDIDIRRLYQVIFSTSDYELTFMENARETRLQANRSRYDLVMVDVEFPTMEGLTVARKMMEEHPNRPLLVVSSVPLQENDFGDSMHRSRSGVLMKPFNIAELRRTIHRMAENNCQSGKKSFDFFQPVFAN